MHRHSSLGATEIEIAAARQALNPPRRRMTTAARRTASLRRSRSKAAPPPADGPSYFAVRDALERIVAMTWELFPAGVNCLEKEDSEIAGDRYFRLRAIHTGSQAEALQKHNDWHAKLSDLPADIRPLFRLSIDARQ